jgi:ABC-type oligopeptide transport system substrate-binding subunit
MAQCKTIVAALIAVALVTAAAFVPAATTSIAATGTQKEVTDDNTIPASADTNLVPAGGTAYSTEGSSASTFGMKEETRGNEKPTLGGSVGVGKNAIYG